MAKKKTDILEEVDAHLGAQSDDIRPTSEGIRFLQRALEELDERPDRIKETRNLRCVLSREERDEKRIVAAKRFAARDILKAKVADLKEQAKSLQKQVDGADQDGSALIAIAESGEEWREVEVIMCQDPDAWLNDRKGVQWDVRRDTLAVEGYRNIPEAPVKRQGDLFS